MLLLLLLCPDILYHHRLVAVSHQQVGGWGAEASQLPVCFANNMQHLAVITHCWGAEIEWLRFQISSLGRHRRRLSVSPSHLRQTSPAHWMGWISAGILTISSQPQRKNKLMFRGASSELAGLLRWGTVPHCEATVGPSCFVTY